MEETTSAVTEIAQDRRLAHCRYCYRTILEGITQTIGG